MCGKILDKKKLIIFDFDGVIFNISEPLKKATQDGIKKYSIKTPEEEITEDLAHLIEEIQNYAIPQVLLNAYDLTKDVAFLNKYRLIKRIRIGIYMYNQFRQYNEDSGIFPGMELLIKSLHKKGYTLCIFTNNKRTHPIGILERYDLVRYFKLIYGFNEVSETKPSPEGILKIMNELKIKNNETIFIGDMTSDIKAGKAAEVFTIGVATGLVPKKRLAQENPDYLFEGIDALCSAFNGEL